MTEQLDTHALRARREACVREHMDAETAHDVERTLKTLARYHYDLVPLGTDTTGEDEVRELLTTVFTAFPDAKYDVLSLHHGVKETIYLDNATIFAQIGALPVA